MRTQKHIEKLYRQMLSAADLKRPFTMKEPFGGQNNCTTICLRALRYVRKDGHKANSWIGPEPTMADAEKVLKASARLQAKHKFERDGRPSRKYNFGGPKTTVNAEPKTLTVEQAINNVATTKAMYEKAKQVLLELL